MASKPRNPISATFAHPHSPMPSEKKHQSHQVSGFAPLHSIAKVSAERGLSSAEISEEGARRRFSRHRSSSNSKYSGKQSASRLDPPRAGGCQQGAGLRIYRTPSALPRWLCAWWLCGDSSPPPGV